MRRRAFLGVTSGVALGGLAGCAAPFGANDETTEPGDDGNVVATETTIPGTTTEEPTTTEADRATDTTTADGETTAEGETTEADETTAGEETTTGAGGTETVQMVTSEDNDYYFTPVGLYVEPGTTVEWVNDSGSHSSTAYAESLDTADVTRIPDDAEPWDSGTLTEEGATFSYTFEVEGTYDYFCLPHKALGMVARVVCGEPGDVEGDPPDGPVPEAQAIVDQGAISYEEFDPGTTTDSG